LGLLTADSFLTIIYLDVVHHYIIDNLEQMKEINTKEKSVLITGGTSGLGLELVKLFLKNRYNVVATGR
jgi:NADPH:quinone reductase-like Zn-dependent oxidoreductase